MKDCTPLPCAAGNGQQLICCVHLARTRCDILITSIGAPNYLTTQAIKALNRTDMFFILDNGEAKKN